MDQLTRLLPYVWRYRSKIYLSVFFAVVVAVLWAATISMSFLIVKVLLQGQSLNDYVSAEIQQTEVAIKAAETHVLKPNRALKQQDRDRSDLSDASHRLVVLNWVQKRIIPWVPKDQFDTYAFILGVLILATVIKDAAMFIQEVLVGSVVELAVMALRKDCFRHALRLDYQTLSLKGNSELMSRFTNDISLVADGLGLLGGKIIREPLKAIACVIGAFYVNWHLTLLSLVFVPLMAGAFHRYGKLLKRASHHMMERMSRIYKSLAETFDGIKIVIAYNGARRARQRFHRENKDYYYKAMKVVRIDALTNPTTESLAMFSVCLSLLPGAYLVLRHTDSIWGIKLASETMEIGQLSVLYALLAGTLDPVRKLSSVYTKLKRAGAATERVFQMMDWKPLLKDPQQPQHMPRHSQSIAFKKILFKYASLTEAIDRPAALNDVSLKVLAGEVVVVVGENGSGKSTLVNLLPRFYDPDGGAVLIDGIDIRNVRLRDLRSQIGVVTQETLLFDDTIYENIRYAKPTATSDEILAAAAKAHVPQFFDQLPEGFETKVGPRGCRLSGGQRQRVALARALLHDPAILILDEATSAIDAQSETMIHQCLGEFVKGRTVFLITHSVTPQILEFVTRIVVMEQGQLLATGSHEDLLRTCPAYQRLYHAQSSSRGSDSLAEFQLESEPNDGTSMPASNAEEPLLIKFGPASESLGDNAAAKNQRRRLN